MFPVPSMPSWPGGRRSVAMRRGARAAAPMHHFAQRSPDLPLSGAQIITQLDVNGNGTGTVGPSGAGTIWNPASATISTSLVPNDAGSVFNLYVGPANVPNVLVGTLLGGNGVLAIALPPMSPGLYLIAVWSGGTPNSTVSMNVIGTYSTLTR